MIRPASPWNDERLKKHHSGILETFPTLPTSHVPRPHCREASSQYPGTWYQNLRPIGWHSSITSVDLVIRENLRSTESLFYTYIKYTPPLMCIPPSARTLPNQPVQGLLQHYLCSTETEVQYSNKSERVLGVVQLLHCTLGPKSHDTW